jgi:hypothetical protein
MQEDTKPPGIGQYALGTTFGILALAAGGISLGMNVTFGLQAGIVTAAIFGLSDCAKMILPVVTAALGWNTRRRIAWIVAVIISVAAAVSYLLESEASRLIQSQHAETAHNGAQADMSRVRRELAAITETGSVEALEALGRAKKADVDAEAANGGCLTKCQEKIAEHGKILERLSQAQRRDKLQALLAEAKETARATPSEALGASDTLAVITGGDKARIASMTSICVSIAMLIILELLATFSGDSARIIRNAMRKSKAQQDVANSVEPVANPASAIAKKTASGTRNYYLNRLQRDFPELAKQVEAGELSCYKASIMAGIRKAPTKDWTKPDAYVGPVKEDA